MTEPRIRPERFTTQPGEVELVKFDDGRWRPPDGRRGPRPRRHRLRPGDGQGRDRAGRGRLEEPRHCAALGRRPGRRSRASQCGGFARQGWRLRTPRLAARPFHPRNHWEVSESLIARSILYPFL